MHNPYPCMLLSHGRMLSHTRPTILISHIYIDVHVTEDIEEVTLRMRSRKDTDDVCLESFAVNTPTHGIQWDIWLEGRELN